MSMPMIAALFLVLGGVWFLFLLWMKVPLTHPSILTLVPQVTILGTTLLDLDSKLEMFQPLTWLILIGSWLAFLAGIGLAVLGTSSWKAEGRHRAKEYRDPWIPVLVGACVYLLGYAWGFWRIGTFPVLSKHPEMARLHFIGSYFHEFLTSFIIPTVSLCLMALRRGASKRFRWFAGAVVAVLIPLYLSTGNRQLSLFFLICFLVFLDLMVRKVRIRTIVVVGLVGIGMFVGVGYLRYGRFMSASSKIKVSKAVELGLRGVYEYAGNGYWNLDYALDRMDEGKVVVPTYGGSIGEGTLVLMGVKDPIQDAYNWDGALNHAVMKIHGLNSTSFHWALIKDFGVAAPVVWSFVWGLGLTLLDRYARLKKSLRATLLYGHMAFYSFIGFMIFPFIIPPPVAGTGILILVLLWMRPRPLPSEQTA
jgi:oligosaccharide repeat unit polymerase